MFLISACVFLVFKFFFLDLRDQNNLDHVGKFIFYPESLRGTLILIMVFDFKHRR